MDFAHVGADCSYAGCKQHDFLPVTCDVCKRVYCDDHKSYEAHKCENAYTKNKIVPSCPVCGQVVPVRSGADPNATINEHINAGCPKVAEKKSAKACSFGTCKKVDLLSVQCKACGRTFCLSHRNEIDHKCEGPPKPQGRLVQQQKQSQRPAKSAPIKKATPAAGPSTAAAKPAAKPVQQKLKPLTKKNYSLATGDDRVPEEKRFYLGVSFPAASGATPRYMFFSKSWTVGKVIDNICNAGRVNNMNNQPGQPKLNLFGKKTKQCLPVGVELENLTAVGCPLKTGDEVLLEFGDEFPAADGKAKQKGDCIVM